MKKKNIIVINAAIESLIRLAEWMISTSSIDYK